MSVGVAFIHGGLHTGWCWERVQRLVRVPTIAPDLPGRGSRPAVLSGLHIGDFVTAMRRDIEATHWTDVVVVAHSLGGLTALGLAAELPSVRHVVFVSCVTPPAGVRPVDALAQPLRAYLTRRMTNAVRTGGTMSIPRPVARRFFCSDLDASDTRLVLDRCVPDAPHILLDRTPHSGLPSTVGRTWIRLTKDRAISPPVQDRMRSNVTPVDVVEIAAGHNAMISQPESVAAVINRVAAAAGGHTNRS